jgi:hypothetical protein
LLDSSFFWSGTVAGMISGGVFAGIGVTGQHRSGSIASGVTTTTAVHGEIDAGVGIDAGVSGDWASSDGNVGVGVAGSGPRQVGYGEGLGAGLGVSITTTVGSPTLASS